MDVKTFTRKKYLFIFFLLFVCSAKAQTADFTFTLTDNFHCTPFRISFSQACTGNPVAFIWDFGNGRKSTSATENVIYTLAGSYNVSLTAIYASHAVSVSKTIIVNATPEIALTANKNQLCKPGAVSFTSTGSSFISSYEWNFGDAGTMRNASVNAVTHNYLDFGEYTAIVKATAASGCSAEDSFPISIRPFNISTSIVADPGCIPVRTVLSATASLPPGDSPMSYSWNFADGSPAANTGGNSTIHIYNTSDSIRTAAVVVNTAQGCSSQALFQPVGFGSAPTIVTAMTEQMKDSFCASETVKFKCRANRANSYKWRFGDSSGITTSDTLVAHRYRTLGEKRVIVTPYFNGCEGKSDTINIVIKGVTSNFYFLNACNDKKNYRFIISSKGNPRLYRWEFSDVPGVQDSSRVSVYHRFPASGTFLASLIVTDSSLACSDTSAYKIYTAIPVLSSSRSTVCKDSLITYKVANTYPGDAGFHYEFHVNGDTILNGTDSTLNAYPTKHGSFSDYVIIKDANSFTCDDTLHFNNVVVRGPLVNFGAPAKICADKYFSVSDSSHPYYATDALAKWDWNYGDNTHATGRQPSQHLYSKAGQYNIQLVATDINGCAQTSMHPIEANQPPGIIAFPAMDTICVGKDTATLAAYTIDSLSWLPATNISCNFCDTTQVYPPVTTAYIAQATNSLGCTSYDTCIVKVFQPAHASIFPSDTSVCPGKTISYRLATDGTISWIPAAGLSNTNNKNAIATPASDIQYSAIVKDSAGCFTDTAVANVHVFALPSVNAGPDQLVNYNSSFSITPVYGSDVISYIWSPAINLNCINCAAPTGNALKTTTYTITTTSVNGCTASDNINIVIACNNSNLLLPTAFSPNGNGINEYFYPIARGYKTIKKFMIFNRRGNKVFERQNFEPNNPSQGWDGRIKNADNVADSETFAWFIEAECEQGELVTNKGTVVLIR